MKKFTLCAVAAALVAMYDLADTINVAQGDTLDVTAWQNGGLFVPSAGTIVIFR